MKFYKFWSWVRSKINAVQDNISSEPAAKWPYPVNRSTGNQLKVHLHEDDFDGTPSIQCGFYYANNGIIIKVAFFDSLGDRKNVKLHIVSNDSEDMRKEIADIIAFEIITNK